MKLFITDKAAIRPLRDQGHDGREAFRRHGVRDQTPFVLASDGSFDLDLNRFFRALPLLKVTSPVSWREYASDIVLWGRWLEEERGKRIWDATFEDMQAFHSARRGGNGSKPVTPSTWNRNVAALNKLYKWAEVQGLVEQNPFVHAGSSRSPDHRGNRFNSGPAPVVERLPRKRLRYLTVEEFDQFCRVGFAGKDLNGRSVPGDRTLQGSRNVTFAEVCVSTGFRLAEANSILCLEVPAISKSSLPGLRFSTPPGVSKRGFGRPTWIPTRIARKVLDYIKFERELAVTKGLALGLYETDRWLRAERHAPGTLLIDGERRRIEDLGAYERRHLVIRRQHGGFEPEAVWLSEDGMPTHRDAWRSAFVRASQRCHSYGLALVASPHTLRHTFAIYALRAYVHLQLADEANSPPADSVAYRRLAFDPLRHVQILMGHASFETTMVYLDLLPEVEGLIPRGMGALVDELGLR